MPEYFDRYINLVNDVEIMQAFDESLAEIDAIDAASLSLLDGVRYAADKWTVKENIQHVMDWERIMSYRALLIARREGSELAGIDETTLAAGMNANDRTIDEILNDLKAARLSTRALFESFNDDMLAAMGKSWKYEISVLALGFTVIGHVKHHLRIVEEKYLSGLAANANVE